MTTKKHHRFANLLIPFSSCPFQQVEKDCPFVAYWGNNGTGEQMKIIEGLKEEELLRLQDHHRICMRNKIEAGEPVVTIKNQMI